MKVHNKILILIVVFFSIYLTNSVANVSANSSSALNSENTITQLKRDVDSFKKQIFDGTNNSDILINRVKELENKVDDNHYLAFIFLYLFSTISSCVIMYYIIKEKVYIKLTERLDKSNLLIEKIQSCLNQQKEELAKIEKYHTNLSSEFEKYKIDSVKEKPNLDETKNKNQEIKQTPITQEEIVSFYLNRPNLEGLFEDNTKSNIQSDNHYYKFYLVEKEKNRANFELCPIKSQINKIWNERKNSLEKACEFDNNASGERFETEEKGEAVLNDDKWEITKKTKVRYV